MYELKKKSTGDYIISGGPAHLTAGVTGRVINNSDYSSSKYEARMSEKALLEKITGIESRNIVMLEQVHSDSILHVISDPSEDQVAAGEADGLITALPGICLVIRTADCVPVFIYDPADMVLGAVHSGWKGTSLDIAGRCVDDMSRIYGSDPEKMHALLFPSIGPESYEVNLDVANLFPDDTIMADGKYHVNLWQNIERSLKKRGIPEKNIFNPRICNRENYGEFFSHRYGDIGRNLNYAFMF